jgi:hypothetical protein
MPEPTTLQAAREQVIDLLCRRFADDALSMPELERRLDRARAARTREELRVLVRDLPGPSQVPAAPGATAAPAPSRPGTPERGAPERGTAPRRRPGGEVAMSGSVAVAILGGTRRAGRWVPPSNLLSVAVMGGVELDFRDAVLAPGSVTVINCFAFWGGIDITVPPDVHLEVGGVGVLGAFEQKGEVWAEPGEDAPTIQVNGLALMGGVEVKVRERGQARGRLRGRRETGRWREDER